MKQIHVVFGLLLVLIAVGLFLKRQQDNQGVVDKAADGVGDFFSGLSESIAELW